MKLCLERQVVIIMINEIKLDIWGRTFVLPVLYECFKDGSISGEQEVLANNLKDNQSWIEDAKKDIIEYCKNDVISDINNQKKDNIFSYIHPTKIYIKRIPYARVNLLLDYKYDDENGLVVILMKDGKIKIGPQYIL